ncbi:MAG: DUF192 domain-containing protein [Pseudomonadota bacterium]
MRNWVRPRQQSGAPIASRYRAAVLGLMFCAGCQASTSPEDLDEPLLDSFGRGELSIVTATAEHHFSVYIADSPEERRQGLQFVQSLPADAGMLFISESSGRQSMWMKNTELPLDMLFVDAAGIVDRIAANTTPKSLKSIASDGNVCCVLELNAGTAKRLGIEAGDRLVHPHFPKP